MYLALPVLEVPQFRAPYGVKSHHVVFDALSVVSQGGPGRQAQEVDVRIGKVVDCWGKCDVATF